jgi:hypothetical protein
MQLWCPCATRLKYQFARFLRISCRRWQEWASYLHYYSLQSVQMDSRLHRACTKWHWHREATFRQVNNFILYWKWASFYIKISAQLTFFLFSLGGHHYGTLSVGVCVRVCPYFSHQNPFQIAWPTTMKMEVQVVWNITPCLLANYRRFEIQKCLYLQSQAFETSVTLTHTASYSRRSGYSAAPLWAPPVSHVWGCQQTPKVPESSVIHTHRICPAFPFQFMLSGHPQFCPAVDGNRTRLLEYS